MPLFKSLLPSLLLIAVYFIADEFFGPETGIYIILGLGITEFIHTRIRKKTYDKMILWTTLFFCFPGLLTFLPVHNVFSRLHPAIVETGLCLLLGISAFSKAGVSILLPASCRQELHLSPLQLKNMRKLISYLFFLLSGHTLLVYAAILFLSPSTAKFVSSTLLCLLLGTFSPLFISVTASYPPK